jgi:molybdopterin converting factor small subunit
VAEVQNESVQVLLFGWLGERFEARELRLPLCGSVRQLWESLPGSAGVATDGVLVARNRSFCTWDAAVQDGDEVAFMPPVSGG